MMREVSHVCNHCASPLRLDPVYKQWLHSLLSTPMTSCLKICILVSYLAAPLPAGDNSQIWRQSPYWGTVSVFRRQVMLKDSYIPKNVDVPRSGECLPFWRLNMSPIRGTFSPSGVLRARRN